MTVYILRHADKEQRDFFNPQLNHQDQPISPKGRSDAQKLCSFFYGKQISAIYVSAYQRTRQTIEYVARQSNITPIVDNRLNEIDNGRFDGLTDQEIQHSFPDIWNAFIERKSDFRFPNGETGEEAQRRIVDMLETTYLQHNDDNVILVSHEGLIRILMCHITGIPVYKRWNFHVDTCGVMEISYQPEYKAWKLYRFNQTCT